MKLKSQTRWRSDSAISLRFISLEFKTIFSEWFACLRCFWFISQIHIIARCLHFTETCKTRKVVAHLSGLQKLENSNLKILKFEARFAYAVKFWTDFFDWILHNFFQVTHSATIFFVCFNAQLTKLVIYFYFTEQQNRRMSTLYKDRRK